MRISDWSSDVCSSDLVDTSCPSSSNSLRRIASVIRSLARSQPACHADRSGYATSHRFPSDEGKAFRECRRSEEHTSELQSLMRISYAVFCLKKKKITKKDKLESNTIHNKTPIDSSTTHNTH